MLRANSMACVLPSDAVLVVRAILPDALVGSSRTAALIEGEQRFRYGVDIQQGKRSRREARTALDGQEGMFGFVEVET